MGLVEVDGRTVVPYLKPGEPFAISWNGEYMLRSNAPYVKTDYFALGVLDEGSPSEHGWRLPARELPNANGSILLFSSYRSFWLHVNDQFDDQLARYVRELRVRLCAASPTELPVLSGQWILNPPGYQIGGLWIGEKALLPLVHSDRSLNLVLEALGFLVLSN